MSMSLRLTTRITHRIVCLLLAKHETELLPMIRIRLRPENDHYTVLQEVIELDRI